MKYLITTLLLFFSVSISADYLKCDDTHYADKKYTDKHNMQPCSQVIVQDTRGLDYIPQRHPGKEKQKQTQAVYHNEVNYYDKMRAIAEQSNYLLNQRRNLKGMVSFNKRKEMEEELDALIGYIQNQL